MLPDLKQLVYEATFKKQMKIIISATHRVRYICLTARNVAFEISCHVKQKKKEVIGFVLAV